MSEGVIKVVGNKIFFHADVNDENVLELITIIHTMEHMKEVTIFIKSDGGDLYAGLSAMDHLSTSPIDITTVADGLCASSASIILMGGDHRCMMPNARILIHQISSDFSGNFEEFKNERRNLKSLMRQVRRIYSEKTEIPDEELDKYMQKDIDLSSSKCVEYGIVECIYTNG